MKTKEEFNQFYSAELEASVNNGSDKHKRGCLIAIALCMFGPAVINLVLVPLFGWGSVVIGMIVILSYGTYNLVAFIKNWKTSNKTEEAFPSKIASFVTGIPVIYERSNFIPRKLLVSSDHIFAKEGSYIGSDLINGRSNGLEFQVSNLEAGDFFKGLLVAGNIHSLWSCRVLIKYKENPAKPFGKVEIADEEFNEKFNVFSDNPEKALRIITPQLIAALLAMEGELNRKIAVSLFESNVIIAVTLPYNIHSFQLGNTHHTEYSYKYAMDYFLTLSHSLNLIWIMDQTER